MEGNRWQLWSLVEALGAQGGGRRPGGDGRGEGLREGPFYRPAREGGRWVAGGTGSSVMAGINGGLAACWWLFASYSSS